MVVFAVVYISMVLVVEQVPGTEYCVLVKFDHKLAAAAWQPRECTPPETKGSRETCTPPTTVFAKKRELMEYS